MLVALFVIAVGFVVLSLGARPLLTGNLVIGAPGHQSLNMLFVRQVNATVMNRVLARFVGSMMVVLGAMAVYRGIITLFA